MAKAYARCRASAADARGRGTGWPTGRRAAHQILVAREVHPLDGALDLASDGRAQRAERAVLWDLDALEPVARAQADREHADRQQFTSPRPLPLGIQLVA